MDIKGIDKAVILKALYDSASPVGMSFMAVRKEEFTLEEARELLKTQSYFDYLYGRLLKIGFKGDVLDTRLFDRDYGAGAAEHAILEVLTRPDMK